MAAGIATDQNKMDLADYRRAATRLFDDMIAYGFRHEGAVPVDRDGELLGGAHRVACALALGLSSVAVLQHRDKHAWAPSWGKQWFADHGMPEPDVKKLAQTMTELGV